jgi:hypothetical protein
MDDTSVPTSPLKAPTPAVTAGGAVGGRTAAPIDRTRRSFVIDRLSDDEVLASTFSASIDVHERRIM